MKKIEASAAALLTTAFLTAGCTGPDTSEGYTATGTVVSFDENQITLGNIQATNVRGGIEVPASETIYDAYRDASCVAHETSNNLDELLAAGSLATGTSVVIAVDKGQSKEHCIAGSSNGGWYIKRSLLASLTLK